MDNQNKNLLLATVLSFLVITGWVILFPPEDPVAPQPEEVAETLAPGAVDEGGVATPPAAVSTGSETTPAATNADTAANAVAGSERIQIDTPKLSGSIALTGGRIDDLDLKDYKETLDA
ncbi:MAG TPA: membrane protein insertase YidC, partial [Maritimibacter sp.]|nr:membrane protein insertase YidC [Maritimibacter sp.]